MLRENPVACRKDIWCSCLAKSLLFTIQHSFNILVKIMNLAFLTYFPLDMSCLICRKKWYLQSKKTVNCQWSMKRLASMLMGSVCLVQIQIEIYTTTFQTTLSLVDLLYSVNKTQFLNLLINLKTDICFYLVSSSVRSCGSAA